METMPVLLLMSLLLADVSAVGEPPVRDQETIEVIVVPCGCSNAEDPLEMYDFLTQLLEEKGYKDVNIVIVGDDGSSASYRIDSHGVPQLLGFVGPSSMGWGTPPPYLSTDMWYLMGSYYNESPQCSKCHATGEVIVGEIVSVP